MISCASRPWVTMTIPIMFLSRATRVPDDILPWPLGKGSYGVVVLAKKCVGEGGRGGRNLRRCRTVRGGQIHERRPGVPLQSQFFRRRICAVFGKSWYV